MKQFILKLSEDAGNLAMEYLGKAKISDKGEKDIVTEADKAVEALIIKKIKEAYPGHNIVSEESGDMKAKSEFTWYIDPIDGTINYSHTDIHFCISIGVAKKGVMQYGCIYLPAIREMYFAQDKKGAELNGAKINVSKIKEAGKALASVGIRPTRDGLQQSMGLFKNFTLAADRVRDYGFCAGELCFIASGKAEILVRISQHVWDIAAGALILREAGGKFTDFYGKDIVFDRIEPYDIAASNGLVHEQVLEIIKKK